MRIHFYDENNGKELWKLFDAGSSLRMTGGKERAHHF
jgi:hypothetical protein